MIGQVRIAAAALNQIPLDWDGNAARIRAAIGAARQQRAALLCLPELCITGYGCEDAFHSPHTARTAWEVLTELLPETHGMVVSLGVPILHQHCIFNVAVMAVDGRIIGMTAKRFLAGDGIHYEPRWFKPWQEGVRTSLRHAGIDVPLGDLYYDIGGLRVGFEICEDAWVANRPGAALARRAVDVILNPSASHFAFDKVDVRRRYVTEGSRAFGTTYVYTNMLGNESGRAIFEGGCLIATGGRLVAEAPRLTFNEVQLVTAQVDIDLARANQARVASYVPHLAPEPNLCIPADFPWPALPPAQNAISLPAWGDGPHRKEEEFARAVALGLFDYLRKSRSQGFVVSLSGGADSAAVTVLCALALRLAVQTLGLDEVRRRLAFIRGIETIDTAEALIRRLILTVYQATSNSSTTTREAARAVAEAVGAEFHAIDVEDIRAHYTRLAESVEGRPLNWERDDLALQNIQARVRAPSIWYLANLRGALLLSTSNRSEAAVGYATMDGDTAGGLAPIAGIDKNYLRRWLRWMETVGPEGVGPMPGLRAVNGLAPTAELRPSERVQTDEADLMPYDVLDAIERLAIRDKKPPVEIWRLIIPAFPGHSPRQLAQWTDRFFRLWCRNQWKRERYAPSFHLDDENLDPKTWCRFPILSGGFERELRELAAASAEAEP
jgi:NAD+ synthase (glutamine-hydrolysing)